MVCSRFLELAVDCIETIDFSLSIDTYWHWKLLNYIFIYITRADRFLGEIVCVQRGIDVISLLKSKTIYILFEFFSGLVKFYIYMKLTIRIHTIGWKTLSPDALACESVTSQNRVYMSLTLRFMIRFFRFINRET